MVGHGGLLPVEGAAIAPGSANRSPASDQQEKPPRPVGPRLATDRPGRTRSGWHGPWGPCLAPTGLHLGCWRSVGDLLAARTGRSPCRRCPPGGGRSRRPGRRSLASSPGGQPRAGLDRARKAVPSRPCHPPEGSWVPCDQTPTSRSAACATSSRRPTPTSRAPACVPPSDHGLPGRRPGPWPSRSGEETAASGGTPPSARPPRRRRWPPPPPTVATSRPHQTSRLWPGIAGREGPPSRRLSPRSARSRPGPPTRRPIGAGPDRR